MPIEELEEEEQTEQEQRSIRPRINPRLVFGNPEVFFLDLLMKQEEQM